MGGQSNEIILFHSISICLLLDLKCQRTCHLLTNVQYLKRQIRIEFNSNLYGYEYIEISRFGIITRTLKQKY